MDFRFVSGDIEVGRGGVLVGGDEDDLRGIFRGFCVDLLDFLVVFLYVISGRKERIRVSIDI